MRSCAWSSASFGFAALAPSAKAAAHTAGRAHGQRRRCAEGMAAHALSSLLGGTLAGTLLVSFARTHLLLALARPIVLVNIDPTVATSGIARADNARRRCRRWCCRQQPRRRCRGAPAAPIEYCAAGPRPIRSPVSMDVDQSGTRRGYRRGGTLLWSRHIHVGGQLFLGRAEVLRRSERARARKDKISARVPRVRTGQHQPECADRDGGKQPSVACTVRTRPMQRGQALWHDGLVAALHSAAAMEGVVARHERGDHSQRW